MGEDVNPLAANMAARNLVLQKSLDMVLPIWSTTVSGTPQGQVFNIPVRNVGLLKRFYIEIKCNFTQGAAETQTLSQNGLANFLSNITFTDLSNQTRVNTSGLFLHNVATARRQSAFAAAFTNDSPTGVGSFFSVIKAPSTVTTVQPLSMVYEVPITYGDMDLRGGIYSSVVNATMNLQFTINPNFSVGTGVDKTLACYQSSTAQVGVLSSMTITVYQNILDQLPSDPRNGQVILPRADLTYAYLLNQTSMSGLVNGQDNGIPYANFRTFLSTILVYANQTGGGNLNAGTDINYFSLQAANYTNIFKKSPTMVKVEERLILNDDFANGVYLFDHRRRPIITTNFGNMQLIVNPSTVNTGAAFLVGYEALANINQVTQASSLPST
jgi:hypothetical protein